MKMTLLIFHEVKVVFLNALNKKAFNPEKCGWHMDFPQPV